MMMDIFFFLPSDWWRVRPNKYVQDFCGDWELSNHWQWYCTPAKPLGKVIRVMKSVRAWAKFHCGSSSLLHSRRKHLTRSLLTSFPPKCYSRFFFPPLHSPSLTISPFRTTQPLTRLLPGLKMHLEQIMRERPLLYHIG